MPTIIYKLFSKFSIAIKYACCIYFSIQYKHIYDTQCLTYTCSFSCSPPSPPQKKKLK